MAFIVTLSATRYSRMGTIPSQESRRLLRISVLLSGFFLRHRIDITPRSFDYAVIRSDDVGPPTMSRSSHGLEPRRILVGLDETKLDHSIAQQ